MQILERLGLRKRKWCEDGADGSQPGTPGTPGTPPTSVAGEASATPPRQLAERSEAAAARMYERGLLTADIAHVLQLDTKEVAMSLVKRARKSSQGGQRAGSSGGTQEGGSSARGSAAGDSRRALHLGARLQRDPPELICPIMHALMEDPVVGEDGHTYERKALQNALRRRGRSPMTNEPMGEVMLPNRALKSRIEEYKGQVLAEILSVAPCLAGECAEDAGALLERAEDLVRPKLPDRAARRTLVQLLQLRTGLPQPHRGSAAPELAGLLAEDGDSARLGEILDRFDALLDADALRSLEEEAAWKLLEVATSQGRPAGVCNGLGRELSRRVVAQLREQDGEATPALRKLWRLLASLCCVDPNAWADDAAALLAACPERLEPDLPALPTRVLARVFELVEDREALEVSVVRILGEALPEAPAQEGRTALAAVLIELAARQEDDAAARTARRASALDPESGAARRSLLALERRRLEAGRRVDEPALLALLQAEGAELPPELLPRLRLEPEELRAAPVPALLALARQLAAAGRGVEAARAEVAAGDLQEAAGETSASAESYRRALSLDRGNGAAAEGVCRALAAASQRCTTLEERLRAEEEAGGQLRRRCLELEEQLRSRDATINALSQSHGLFAALARWKVSHLRHAVH